MNRRSVLISAATLAALATCAAPASAAPGDGAGPQDHYCARLSRLDHYGARGQRLTTVGAIIRQDRRNFLKPGRRDKEDQADRLKSQGLNREAFEDRIDDLHIKLKDRHTIINGTPRICVTVKGPSVAIAVIDETKREEPKKDDGKKDEPRKDDAKKDAH